MKKNIMTISRQFGSGGRTVGNLEKMEIKLSNTVVYTAGEKGV